MNKLACLVFSALFFILAGCANTNPEVIGTSVDARSTISFTSEKNRAKVYLDGNLVGRVGDYKAGDDALGVLPGTHKLIVIDTNDEVLYQQRIYLNKGVNKVINIY